MAPASILRIPYDEIVIWLLERPGLLLGRRVLGSEPCQSNHPLEVKLVGLPSPIQPDEILSGFGGELLGFDRAGQPDSDSDLR